MSIIQIEYVGCAYSGRRESVKHALKHFGASYVDNQDVHQIEAFSHAIRLGVSRQRAVLHYETKNKDSLDPSVAQEIKRLCDSDGIIFVVDSQRARLEACKESHEQLVADMALFGCDANKIPTVFQINKRDLPGICDPEWVHRHFMAATSGYTESVAVQGVGVVETIAALMNLIKGSDEH